MGKNAIFASVLLCACGPKGGGGTAEPPKPEAKELCVDPASPGGTSALPNLDEGEPTWQASGDEELGAPLDDGWHLMSRITTEQITYGVIVAEAGYDPHVVRVEGGAITANVPLPEGDTIPSGGDYPFFVTWVGAADDGSVWVLYNIVGEPEAAVGSTTKDYLTILAPGDLAVQLHATVGAYPEAGVLETCTSDVVSVDADCDGDLDLIQHETCLAGECKKPDWESDSWVAPDYCPPEDAPPVSHTVYDRGADGTYTQR